MASLTKSNKGIQGDLMSNPWFSLNAWAHTIGAIVGWEIGNWLLAFLGWR